MLKGHKLDCQCSFCKNKRGEFKGKNHLQYKHGGTGTRLYGCWERMRYRCQHRPNYIKKGIKVYPEWLDKEKGFINFKNWALFHGYKNNLVIHRKRNHLNYNPENCEWINPSKHRKWHWDFYRLKQRTKKFLEKFHP